MSKKKTEAILTPAQEGEIEQIQIEAVGQRYGQIEKFILRGSRIAEVPHVISEIARRAWLAWLCFRNYDKEICDLQQVLLGIKVRRFNGEVTDTVLFGSVA